MSEKETVDWQNLYSGIKITKLAAEAARYPLNRFAARLRSSGMAKVTAKPETKKQMLAAGLAKQVRVMHFEKQLTVEQIAESLGLDVGEVSHTLITAPESAHVPQVKGLLQAHVVRAAEVLGELLEDYQNPHLQLHAAKFISEVDLGKHDPPKKVDTGGGITMNQFNVIIQESDKAYENALRAAGIKKPETIDVDAKVTIEI